MKLKKKSVKKGKAALKPIKKEVPKKEVIAKKSNAEKKKENEANMENVAAVMAKFESGALNLGNKKKPNGISEKAPEKVAEAPKNNKRQLKKWLSKDGLLVKHEEGSKWYNYQINEVIEDLTQKSDSSQIGKLLNEGREILAQDVALLQTKEKQENSSEASWLYSVMSKGTAADRRTAMQLQMHKSPVHSLEYIEKLIASCRKQGTRDIIDIIPILEDVFINYILPENRKLVLFSKRPLGKINALSSGNERSRRKILMLWAFENEAKILYQQFIEALTEVVKRPLEDVSKRALKTLTNLLAERPEAESLLLSTIVNAFGHPNYKIGSYVVYLLENVSRKHPAMRIVMAQEIERLIFRKNVNERAHTYSTTFLSQMCFNQNDSDLACRLMSIYLALFKTIVSKKITNTRLLPIILSGANRAFPFAKDVTSLLDDVKDVYYLAHNSSFRTAIPAFRLLFQFHKTNEYVSDRFYNALYRKLLDDCPPAAYAQFLKLLFDTLKEDSSAQRVRAFVKRLLQVAVNAPPEFAASILLLISKIKILREDPNLIVLRKDADPTAKNMAQEDDEEEHFVDLDAEGNAIQTNPVKSEKNEDIKVEEVDDKKAVLSGKLGASSSGGWVHREQNAKRVKSPHDSVARNPLFVDASQSADNELLLLSQHFHPSVAVFAKALLENGEINYCGDSLNDFALMSFLDRFAFRNPKDVQKSGVRVTRKKAHDPWGVRKLAVSSKEYMKKRRDEIPADERFLHRYASTLLKEKKKDKKEGDEDDEWEYAESVNSEEFDAILDRFEPGELNDEFDIDYGKEFSAEKNKKNNKKDDVDIDEDDLELDDADDDDDDEEGFENDDDDDDEDVEEDDEDLEDDDEDDNDDDDDFGGRGGKSSSNIFGDDDVSSDEEIGENDFEMAGDKFAEMLENIEEDDDDGKKKKTKKGKGIKRSKRGPSGGNKKMRRR
ncbi:unnamed protein product [Caenorhabditis bovis]|uniref:CCAAT-binding factor domain-containing protein n=1 Tax=Caenorhabditis bovis TaxID=2654633 RepID=A0A8S1E7U4_9PELO|nr:unnamed protein product [Caenorhabditis bovis]